MKSKVLLAALAVAFSFAVTSCGNKKAAADSCCAAQTEQVGDSAKACCKAACDKKECDKACDKKECGKACDKKECDKACDQK